MANAADMASLFLRDDTWWVQYYDRGRPRRESLNTKSKARAKREKVALEAKLLEPGRLVKDEQNALIADFWREYLFWASQHLEPATRTLHERFWGYLMEHAQPKRLEAIPKPSLRAKRGNLVPELTRKTTKDRVHSGHRFGFGIACSVVFEKYA